jgi:hypothetical protein
MLIEILPPKVDSLFFSVTKAGDAHLFQYCRKLFDIFLVLRCMRQGNRVHNDKVAITIRTERATIGSDRNSDS